MRPEAKGVRRPPMCEVRSERRGETPAGAAPSVATTRDEAMGVVSPVPGFRRVPPHVRQAYNWDCGLACVLMIVHANGMKHVDLRYLRDACGTTSIWTVDIAHLLRHFGLQVKFYTITLGVNPAYADEKFYKDHMYEDEVRVRQLFDLAPEAGVEVGQRSLELHELRDVCSSPDNLVLILVDKRVLQAGAASAPSAKSKPSLFCCGMLGGLGRSGYVGHYVVLYDYNHQTKEFLIKDPASFTSKTAVKEAVLEKARKSFGTDEDVIVVPYLRPTE